MSFLRYQHVEKIGSDETDGILDGQCWFFPKIDGTNGQIWYENGIRAGSRNRELEINQDNAGFLNSVLNDDRFKAFCLYSPNLRLYGEWLVPHSLKTYDDSAWRKFWVFDVYDGDTPIPYEEYTPILDSFGIDYIPPLFVCDRPSEERITKALAENTFLIKDGHGIGEGVVIKRYDFVNRFGRKVWAKAVTNEFKAKHTKAMGPRVVKEKARVEDQIALEFVTKPLVDKVWAKIVNENGSFGSRDIPRLLNTVWYDLIREEMWDILKWGSSPTIDFKSLQKAVFAVVKLIKPEAF